MAKQVLVQRNVRSFTKPGVSYMTYVFGDFTVACSCPDFFRHYHVIGEHAYHCKHVTKVLRDEIVKLNDGGKP